MCKDLGLEFLGIRCTVSLKTAPFYGLTQSCSLWLQNKDLFASEGESDLLMCANTLQRNWVLGCRQRGGHIPPSTETESGSALPVRPRIICQNDPFDSGAGNPLRLRSCVIIALIRLGQIQPVWYSGVAGGNTSGPKQNSDGCYLSLSLITVFVWLVFICVLWEHFVCVKFNWKRYLLCAKIPFQDGYC